MTAQARPSRAGRWLAARTLRGRLIAGLLGLLALACATVGAVTYTHLHTVLIGQLDTELTSASLRYTGCVQPPPGAPGPPNGVHPAPFCAQQQALYAFTAVISDGTVTDSYIASTATRPAKCDLSVAERAELTAVPVGRAVTVDLSGHGQYRMTATRTAAGTVVTGLPLTAVSRTLQQVAIAEVAVFLAALLITGVIGTAWVRASLRPLRRVAATAARVTQLPLASGEVSLTERVPDADPRTEVGQVGAAFNRMLGHVESSLAKRAASEARLRSFAADASHELRTPLASIRGYAELARRQPEPLPDQVAHALSRVESESARMSLLVDELLLLAQLDAGRPLASEPVDLTRLAIDVTSDARVAAPGHRWQLELPDEPVVVSGDEQRLHQVLANLLGNAARHTPAGTATVVAVSASEGHAIVSVTDNGPGIPPDLQPDVFERFVRGDSSRSRAAGSSGLGLAIVQAVTAAHGGQVQVTSRPGETRFTITLPAV
ncbi:MAG TPA: HAMP domain-containing sensor histidine kinase [Streptosporangiaceae bacterium]|nr:HAMP domain-containing sensor histidine kinase [Streptosporangiaceae bacterium]